MTYAISGVWKDTNGVITDYAIHLVIKSNKPGMFIVNKAKKYSKARAIKLVNAHFVRTAVWNYTLALWDLGAKVDVVDDSYLRSRADSTVRDNLENLLNYGAITII